MDIVPRSYIRVLFLVFSEITQTPALIISLAEVSFGRKGRTFRPRCFVASGFVLLQFATTRRMRRVCTNRASGDLDRPAAARYFRVAQQISLLEQPARDLLRASCGDGLRRGVKERARIPVRV